MFALMLMIGFGCSDKLDEVNVDTNSPTEVTVAMRLTYSINQIFEFISDEQNDRMGSIFSQYFSNGDGRETFDVYDLNGATGSGFYLYRNGLKEIVKMYEEIEESGVAYNHHMGVAKVLEAIMLGSLTSAMGDVPYSQAVAGSENLNPQYDSQELIYQTIQQLLDEGITQLSANDAVALSGDFVLGNDPSQWIILANLMKARYYNHLSVKDPSGSATSALAAIDAAIAAGWDTSMNVEMRYEGNENHRNNYSFYQFDVPINASYRFLDLLKTNNDPRTFAYFNPLSIRLYTDAQVNEDPDDAIELSDGAQQILAYRPELADTDTVVLDVIGERIGNSNTTAEYASAVGLVFSSLDANAPIMLAAEAKFIEAEAALRASDPTRAAEAFAAAVEAHLNFIIGRLTDQLTTYTTENSTLVDEVAGAQAAIDNMSIQVADYITNLGTANSSDITLERIMTEKYKAMYIQGVESWMDLRRHDFAFPSGYFSSPVASGEYAQRLPYPNSDVINNQNVTQTDLFDIMWVVQ